MLMDLARYGVDEVFLIDILISFYCTICANGCLSNSYSSPVVGTVDLNDESRWYFKNKSLILHRVVEHNSVMPRFSYTHWNCIITGFFTIIYTYKDMNCGYRWACVRTCCIQIGAEYQFANRLNIITLCENS